MAVGCARRRGVKNEEDVEEQMLRAIAQVQFGQVTFVTPTQHLSGDVGWAIGYISLDFSGEGWLEMNIWELVGC